MTIRFLSPVTVRKSNTPKPHPSSVIARARWVVLHYKAAFFFRSLPFALSLSLLFFYIFMHFYYFHILCFYFLSYFVFSYLCTFCIFSYFCVLFSFCIYNRILFVFNYFLFAFSFFFFLLMAMRLRRLYLRAPNKNDAFSFSRSLSCFFGALFLSGYLHTTIGRMKRSLWSTDVKSHSSVWFTTRWNALLRK